MSSNQQSRNWSSYKSQMTQTNLTGRDRLHPCNERCVVRHGHSGVAEEFKREISVGLALN